VPTPADGQVMVELLIFLTLCFVPAEFLGGGKLFLVGFISVFMGWLRSPGFPWCFRSGELIVLIESAALA
jgi:hypothetical protein